MQRLETPAGYLAFQRVRGAAITLGPPICDPADRPLLLGEFLKAERKPLLCYVEAELLRELAHLGAPLHAAGIGVDKHVDLDALLRSPPASVASAARKARRAGFELEELPLSAVTPAVRERLGSITRDFVARSRVPVEMAFLNRPMSLEPDDLRRVFLLRARVHHGVFGYAVLNPWFEHEQVAGYLLDIIRFERTRLWGVYLATVHGLAERLATEGHALSLGFCPLWRVPDPTHLRSTLLQAQLRWMERSLREVAYVKHLQQMKSRIPGPLRPRFLASRSRSAVHALTCLVSACGVPLRVIFGAELVRAVARSRAPSPGAARASA